LVRAITTLAGGLERFSLIRVRILSASHVIYFQVLEWLRPHSLITLESRLLRIVRLILTIDRGVIPRIIDRWLLPRVGSTALALPFLHLLLPLLIDEVLPHSRHPCMVLAVKHLTFLVLESCCTLVLQLFDSAACQLHGGFCSEERGPRLSLLVWLLQLVGCDAWN
jgi:hypothetical protein